MICQFSASELILNAAFGVISLVTTLCGHWNDALSLPKRFDALRLGGLKIWETWLMWVGCRLRWTGWHLGEAYVQGNGYLMIDWFQCCNIFFCASTKSSALYYGLKTQKLRSNFLHFSLSKWYSIPPKLLRYWVLASLVGLHCSRPYIVSAAIFNASRYIIIMTAQCARADARTAVYIL